MDVLIRVFESGKMADVPVGPLPCANRSMSYPGCDARLRRKQLDSTAKFWWDVGQTRQLSLPRQRAERPILGPPTIRKAFIFSPASGEGESRCATPKASKAPSN